MERACPILAASFGGGSILSLPGTPAVCFALALQFILVIVLSLILVLPFLRPTILRTTQAVVRGGRERSATAGAYPETVSACSG